MKAREATLSIALLLAIACSVHSEESVEDHGAASVSDLSAPSVHLAKKRSAAAVESPTDVLLDSYSPYLSAPAAADDKRSSLFRFGKRQGSLFRFGKRDLGYSKRQGSLFRYGKRAGGGTLFRFGRSGGEGADLPASLGYFLHPLTEEQRDEVRQQVLDYIRQAELRNSPEMMDKRQGLGFHWGSDE